METRRSELVALVHRLGSTDLCIFNLSQKNLHLLELKYDSADYKIEYREATKLSNGVGHV